ncbi:PDDEXK nuclease domain-containing protein [Pseudorhodoferax aquiterrae]|uniref:PDDEXK nuclease domain-containing protein n=1 Tax=Pseudorhodoferax aquiterrae TaxID=747304 RepID=UPI001E4BC916|nr:PDDEXK nuclease domain-containing protein [Pseudorhodoferax aquiterrae]
MLAARQSVARGVDLVQVRTCFEIGRHIVEHEQGGQGRAAYGQALLKGLAERLTQAFGRGFAKSNLEYMRRFYLAYASRADIAQLQTGQSGSADSAMGIAQFQTGKSQASVPFSLSWTHYVFLLGINNPDERSFYEIEASQQGWSLKHLRRQFDSGLFERLALSRDKDGLLQLAQQGHVVERPEDMLKEPLVLEFLGLSEQAGYSESDLETAVINQIGQFLLELGKGFLFEARQKRFSFDGDHFFVDLVFYNRLLRCYVLIDLKLGKLTHQDLGQMQMYVNYFDRHVKTEAENATVGIVLCKKKNEALVEITLPIDANIHAREYSLYLPSKEELKAKLQEWMDGTHR